MDKQNILMSTTTIVTAFAGAQHMTIDMLQDAITRTHDTLIALFDEDAKAKVDIPAEDVTLPAALRGEPATTKRKSLASPEHIISMIDGKPYKTLRRHLATHGVSPEQYRERYGLGSDYPLVAPSYSAARSAMAKEIGLGRKPSSPLPSPI